MKRAKMESQASLMVNCMLLAFRKLRLYDDVDNSNYTIFTNITSTLNLTMLDSQRVDNDSLETNALDSPSYHRNIYQWVAKIAFIRWLPVSFIMYIMPLCVFFHSEIHFALFRYSHKCLCIFFFCCCFCDFINQIYSTCGVAHQDTVSFQSILAFLFF